MQWIRNYQPLREHVSLHESFFLANFTCCFGFIELYEPVCLINYLILSTGESWLSVCLVVHSLESSLIGWCSVWASPSDETQISISPSGNLGSKLVEYKEEMYITSDCGKTWRQVHHTLFSSLVSCLFICSPPNFIFAVKAKHVLSCVEAHLSLLSRCHAFSWYFAPHQNELHVPFEGFWGGASHSVPGPWRGHCCHQGHIYSPQDTQVRPIVAPYKKQSLLMWYILWRPEIVGFLYKTCTSLRW